jgi:hypothetical protein
MPENEDQLAPEPSLEDLKAISTGKAPAPAPAPEPKPATSEAPPAAAPVAPEPPPAEPKIAEAVPGTAPEPQKIEPEAPPQPKKPTGLERRFSRLTRERDEALAEADRARKELETAKQAPAAPQVAKPEAGEPAPPDPATWAGTYEELEGARTKYAKDIAVWTMQQARKEVEADLKRRQEEASGEGRARELQASWEGRAQKALAANPEFQEAVDVVGPLVTQLGMADLIKESEVGPEIVQELYENTDERTRISNLQRFGNPLLVARELGKLEARLTAAKAAKTAPPPKAAPVAPPLPKPPATPGGGGVAAEQALEDLPIDQFKTKVRAQLHG